jgi:catalase
MATYWSQTPYRFGTKVARYSVKPDPANDAAGARQSSRDFLREALVEHLTENKKEARFDFYIQFAPDENPKWEHDPTLAWNEEIAPLIKVATITIPAQEFDTFQQRQFCEALSYTPWHCLPEHQPLGQINRARRAVYRASSRLRHWLRKIPRKEPSLADRPAPWPNIEQSGGCGCVPSEGKGSS